MNIETRKNEGIKMSLIGIFINFILFVAKLSVGIMANSIAMKADAINNLSDFASAIILLISFYISSRPADQEHPFGHARFEYIASTIVSMIIVFIGFQLGSSSLGKINNPEIVKTDIFFYIVFILSIIVKSYLYYRYKKESKKLDSPILMATAKDSFSDIISTAGLFVSILFGQFFNKAVDGYIGFLISIFIVYTGISILFKTSNRLLGVKADSKLRNEIKQFIRDHDGIYGVHDLIIHDYGVQNYFASVHVEVNAADDIKVSHELIDHIEREVAFKFHINIVLHMDPIDLHDDKKDQIQSELVAILEQIDSHISMHDFRILADGDQNKIIFDLKVRDGCKLSNQEIRQKITEEAHQIAPQYTCYMDIDRNYEVDIAKVPFKQDIKKK
ncbi:MAG: cation transporter [Clostridiaceae bacterium]|nr:cation transporter [Clostridiaceae bacterium]